MSALASPEWLELETRARQSLGASDDAIYRMVARALADYNAAGGSLVDVGCGSGRLWSFVKTRFSSYTGVDAVRYDGFPDDSSFIQANLDQGPWPLADGLADAVVAVEVIEHLENPRSFMRELVRLVKPGGVVIVTTPNQLSFLSLLTLVFKKRFSAFQDIHYPAHLTALLEIDLRRIAAEAGLQDIRAMYSHHGRVVLTSRHYPAMVARLAPRACSDNVLVIGRKRSETN